MCSIYFSPGLNKSTGHRYCRLSSTLIRISSTFFITNANKNGDELEEEEEEEEVEDEEEEEEVNVPSI